MRGPRGNSLLSRLNHQRNSASTYHASLRSCSILAAFLSSLFIVVICHSCLQTVLPLNVVHSSSRYDRCVRFPVLERSFADSSVVFILQSALICRRLLLQEQRDTYLFLLPRLEVLWPEVLRLAYFLSYDGSATFSVTVSYIVGYWLLCAHIVQALPINI